MYHTCVLLLHDTWSTLIVLSSCLRWLWSGLLFFFSSSALLWCGVWDLKLVSICLYLGNESEIQKNPIDRT